jgi:sugar/nucleoside kinase (ribokinase family)
VNSKIPDSLFLGQLEREYLINAQGQIFVDQPGGNLLYAAAGFGLWEQSAGLISRVGSDYPLEWLDDFERKGFDVAGIRKLDEAIDLRSFTAYSSIEEAHHEQPIKHFAELNSAFPKSLLGYEWLPPQRDSRKTRPPLSLREGDIPESYENVKAAHLCSMDFFSHSLMPAALREKGIKTITMDAGAGYLHPDYWNELTHLMAGLSAFLIHEKALRTFFSGRSDDIWEMAAMLCSFNCRAVVIKRANGGTYLYEAEGEKRYRLPPYPSQAKDITHNSSSFSGGFLAGLIESDDLLQACVQAEATRSIANEGSGAYYAMGSLKGLGISRMESLSQAIQTV